MADIKELIFAAPKVQDNFEHVLYYLGIQEFPQLYNPQEALADPKLFQTLILDLSRYIPYGGKYPDYLLSRLYQHELYIEFPWLTKSLQIIGPKFTTNIPMSLQYEFQLLFNNLSIPSNLNKEEIIQRVQGIHTTTIETIVCLFRDEEDIDVQELLFPIYLDVFSSELLIHHLRKEL